MRYPRESAWSRPSGLDDALSGGRARTGRRGGGPGAGDTTQVFTSLAVPVMTRLRQPERLVLDTLDDSGVARSRSDALAWCVKLVGTNTEEWLRNLRDAMQAVESVRRRGPDMT